MDVMKWNIYKVLQYHTCIFISLFVDEQFAIWVDSFFQILDEFVKTEALGEKNIYLIFSLLFIKKYLKRGQWNLLINL